MDISNIYWTNNYNDVELEDYSVYRKTAKNLLWLTALKRYGNEQMGAEFLNDEDIITNATAAVILADVTYDKTRKTTLKTHRVNHIKWYIATYFSNRDAQIKKKPHYHFSHHTDDVRVFQTLPDDNDPVEQACSNEICDMIKEAIQTSPMTEREKQYLFKYYNIGVDGDYTYRKLGAEHNHSTQRARQIVVQAKRRLKIHIKEKYPALMSHGV